MGTCVKEGIVRRVFRATILRISDAPAHQRIIAAAGERPAYLLPLLTTVQSARCSHHASGRIPTGSILFEAPWALRGS